MNECPHLLDAEMWLDGEADERASAIARHVAACPICKAHVETVRRLDFASREAGILVKAPEALLDRLNDLDAARPALETQTAQSQPVSRRWVFAGMTAAAASVAAVTTIAWRSSTREAGEDLSLAVFGDFATHLDADRDLDLTETDARRVMDWFTPKVPFPMPQLASLSELDLIGGRLCWLLDRRIAAFNFNHGGKALGLYVADATGLTCQHAALPKVDEPPTLVTQERLNGAFWRDGDLAHALVGEPSLEVVEQFASLLHT